MFCMLVLLIFNTFTSSLVNVYGPLRLTVYIPLGYEVFANSFNTVAISSPVFITPPKGFVNVTLYCSADKLYTLRYLSGATI